MKSLDNKIKYYELLMFYSNTSNYKEHKLPSGFHWEYYKPGDEEEWVQIHISSGEFTSIEEGLKHFHDFYDYFIHELNKRCIFIVDDKTNEKIGTVTISLLEKPEFGYEAAVDWLAIKRDYQGKHLSKPLISKTVELAKKLGHSSIILHTQTTTWLAAKLYLDYGFEILNKEDEDGWNILKTIVDHPKLKSFNALPIQKIYDSRNVEIENQLNKIFGIDNFNYSVWYKNGLHNIYVYSNNTTYEFEYFIDENGLQLLEIANKQFNR